jgi:hypothetical protein
MSVPRFTANRSRDPIETLRGFDSGRLHLRVIELIGEFRH